MQNPEVRLIGVYSVEANPEVSLVELMINKKANEIDIGEFTQKVIGQPRLNWQAPFGEKYLDQEGRSIIGDDMNLPEPMPENTRLTFFFYYLDSANPLITPFGELELATKTEQPKRIKELIFFEDPE